MVLTTQGQESGNCGTGGRIMVLTTQGQEDGGLANRWITLTRLEQREWGLKDTHYYWRDRAAIVNVAMEQ